MARFMRAIHVFSHDEGKEDVDDPDKPGHDEFGGRRLIPRTHKPELRRDGDGVGPCPRAELRDHIV